MAAIALTEVTPELDALILRLARQAVIAAARGEPAPKPELSSLPPTLRQPGACFVSLHAGPRLRGCIGNLEAREALALSLLHNASSACRRDPRFKPVNAEELAALQLEVSILEPAESLVVSSEQELLDRLRPGIDGLILEQPPRRATFLPTVWQSLPEPREFLRQLKIKGGWDPDYWSSEIKLSTYRTRTLGPVQLLAAE